MIRKRYLALASALALCTACAGNTNLKIAQDYYNTGRNYEMRGDPVSAQDFYGKALAKAKQANADPSLISMLTYNYGRMLGHSCQYEEAEKNLVESLAMEKSISGPGSELTTIRLFELARLNSDNDRHSKASNYFGEAISAAKNLGVEQSDPIGYTLLLGIYKDSLVELNRQNQADRVQSKIDTLIARNPGKSARYTPQSYRCE